MKKILLIPAVIGLITVPSFVVAHRGADDNKPNDVRQEDSSSQTNTDSDDSSNHNDSPDSSDDNSNSAPAPASSGSVTLEQAKTIALGVFPDKTIKKVETELEHGVLVYSVRFSDSSRVDVNSNDESIVRTEQEDDNHIEDNESDDDSHNSSDDNEDDS